MPDRAIILAAGLGLRMRPFTEHTPKPLLPVAGRTLLDRALDFAQEGGVARAVVNISYLAPKIEEHLAARAGGPHVLFSREESPLETGGGIRQALPMLGDAPFFSINSDVICLNGPRHALRRLAEAWDGERMDALLLLIPRARAVGFEGAGDFSLSGENVLVRRGEAASAPYVFSGVQLIHPRLMENCPPEGAFSLNLLYDRTREADGCLPRRCGLVHDGDWLHVGDLAGLSLAEEYFRGAPGVQAETR